MKAKALICNEEQNFSIEDVELQDPEVDQIVVRTEYSGVSVGTEFALIRNKISWGPYPLCTGYMGSGVVEYTGNDIQNFKQGDKVYFRANGNMTLPGGEAVSCVSGTHCSHVVLNPNTSHGADHVFAGCSMDIAAMFVMPAVGLHGVDISNPQLGDFVVINGCGLIGLGALAACVHRGCKVIAVDLSDKQLTLAREFGADFTVNCDSENVKDKVMEITGDGADVVFECTGIPACVNSSIQFCKNFGSYVWQGNYGEKPVGLDFLLAHGKQVKMFFPCDDGLAACRRAVIKNMAMDALKWDKVISHRIDYTAAPDIFSRINAGDKDIIGVVLNWR